MAYHHMSSQDDNDTIRVYEDVNSDATTHTFSLSGLSNTENMLRRNAILGIFYKIYAEKIRFCCRRILFKKV